MLNKATTDTWYEEKQAYNVLREATRLLRSYFAYLKFKSLKNYIINVEWKARSIVEPVAHIDPGRRDLCS